MRWSESRKVEIIRGVSHIRSGVIFGLSIFSIVVGDHLWSILVILIVVRQKPWLSVATTSWPLLVNEHRMQAGHTFFASLLRMDLILVTPPPPPHLRPPPPTSGKGICILESGKFFLESGKFFLVVPVSGILGFEIRNTAQVIRIPLTIRIWNPIFQNLF